MSLQQLFVSTLLHHPALVKDNDVVSVSDGCQAMGDEDDYTCTRVFQEGFEDLCLGLSIEGAHGLVQYQDLRVPEEGPGDGDALALPS